MCVNVSNAARRTHDRTGGQVYFPASQDIAGHGSGGRTSRPANCEWAALLVATGPGPLLGKNGGGATATHGVLLPRVIPSAAQIGRASCRERGRMAGAVVPLTKKTARILHTKAIRTVCDS